MICKLTKKRVDQLVRECTQDLEKAKIQGHKAWIETLINRLISLKKMKVIDGESRDTCLIVIPEAMTHIPSAPTIRVES